MTGLADSDARNALLWVPWRTQYDDGGGDRVTDNLGRASGYPATVTMGDGATAATFPTQFPSHRGVGFDDGARYANTGIVDPYERNEPFSTVLGVDLRWNAGVETLWAWSDVAQSRRGSQFLVWDYDADNLWEYEFRLINSDAAVNFARCRYTPTLGQQGFRTLITTYDGSSTIAGMRLFEDGVELTPESTNDTLTDTIDSGKELLVGARWNGAAPANLSYAHRLSFLAVYPFELSASQALRLHARIRREVSQP